VGSDVSHGCIRMRNEAVTVLAPVLPLGAPLESRP
jgi:lipoprotein-anchoring transpeptidase ErfK/SrfK